MATLPTTAAPRAAAEAAMRRTRTAAKKEVVATATAGSAGAVTSPALPALPAKRKRKRLQPVEPTCRQSRTETKRMCAIPLLDGGCDASLGSETASQLASPPPATPPPLTTPSPPSDPATVKNLCSSCMASPVFNYERRICKECLEKSICTKCLKPVCLRLVSSITSLSICISILRMDVKDEIYT
jgi:hypothetical protein